MITITTVAEEKIRELMREEKDTVGLRVYVKGGGCHGYQYGMAFESATSDDDTVIEKGDVKVIMDSQSAPYWPDVKSISTTACKAPALRSRTRRRKRPVGAAVHSAHKVLAFRHRSGYATGS